MFHFLSKDVTYFFDFIPKDTDANCQKYIYVIKIDDRNFRRFSSPLDKDFVFDIPEHVLNDVKANLCIIVFDYTIECFDCTHSNPSDLVRFFIESTMCHFKFHKDQVILLVGNLKPFKEVPFTVCTANHSIYTLIPFASNEFVKNQFDLVNNRHVREYKIMCLMRNPRLHRLKFAQDIFSNNLKNDNLITCRHTIKDFNVNFFNFFKENISNQKFINSLPWVYDYDEDQPVLNLHLRTSIEEDLYLNSFVNFAIETYVDHTSNTNSDYELDISEKVFKPIARMQPFVILGQQGIIEYLHSQGYKTFDRWWDESYDLDTDSSKRYDKVFSIFKKISSMPKEELANMLVEMQDILIHNSELFEYNKKTRSYLVEFKETLTNLFDK